MIYFYHSVAFPKISDELKEKIKGYNVLICNGFLPDVYILSLTTEPITFIGTNKTCYYSDEYKTNELYYKLKSFNICKWIKYETKWEDNVCNYTIFNKTIVNSIDDFF